MSLLLRLALSLLVAAAMATAAHAERRIALVIGNSAYSGVSPLANPKNDADLMAKTLKSVGFEVTMLVDADQRTMKQAMLDFGRKLRAGADASLFYYSGHGVQAKGENYLIPVDAAIKDEGELDLQAIDVNAFLQVMDNASSKVNIIILDACRNNPFASSLRSASRGLTMVDAPRGTYIAYSTGVDQVAEDGTGANSPYTEALARAIIKPGVKLEDAFKEARRLVEAATDNKQVPWETTSITGDFYFLRKAQKPPAAPPANPDAPPSAPPSTPPRSPAVAPDETAWQTIAASTDPADFAGFLQAFPHGPHADDAKARQASLAAANREQLAATPGAGQNPAVSPAYVLLGRWRTPSIAADKFHEAQQKFPDLLGDKRPILIEDALKNGGTGFRIRIGPFPDVQQASDFCNRLKQAAGFCQMPAPGEADEPANLTDAVLSRGKLQVPQSFIVNLEAGAVTPSGHGGLRFEAAKANDLYLVPMNGAALAPGDLSQRGFGACATETYSTGRLSLRNLPPGSFVCVKTGGGRIGRMRIDAISPSAPRTLALNYVVWQ
jgi:hypothetical protein